MKKIGSLEWSNCEYDSMFEFRRLDLYENDTKYRKAKLTFKKGTFQGPKLGLGSVVARQPSLFNDFGTQYRNFEAFGRFFKNKA